MTAVRGDALTIFGITGDLAFKKIFPSLQGMLNRGALDVPVIGVAFEDWDVEQLRKRARESIEEYGGGVDEKAFERLSKLLRYVGGDYENAETFERLRKELGDAQRPVHYLAIPPSMFPTVGEGLGRSGCAKGARVVVEKPFGRDLASARSLNSALHSVFEESNICRIDHFLGKETVSNLVHFRFANSFVEPITNRNYVDSVQITMAEEFGVSGRGRFYEEAGAIRDVVQNHLLQIVSLVAMEPPVGPGSDSLRDEKVRVLKSIRPPDPAKVVRGQFQGYRDEDGVAADSQVETFVALELRLDSWRWQDVPFFIRTGKSLPLTATEVTVVLREPPQHIFSEIEVKGAKPNYLRFRLGPEIEIAIGAQMKAAGEAGASNSIELFACKDRHEFLEPYDRLLGDALAGEARLFAREDELEAAWRIIDPILENPSPVHEYAPGSWGPAESDRLVADHGGWRDPKPVG